MRAAIYANLSPPRRTALHLAAARLTAGAVALSHRVAAATVPDAALAAELAELAAAESAAGLHAAAAGHLVSGADLSTDPARREDRLLAAYTSGCGPAVHEVSSRRALLDTLAPSSRRDHLRGFLAHLEGCWDEAREALRAASRQLQPVDGGDPLASEVAARLAGLAVFQWDTPTALALVQAVPDTGARLPLLIRCIALTMAGRSAEARNVLGVAYPGAAPDRNSTLECLSRGLVRRPDGGQA